MIFFLLICLLFSSVPRIGRRFPSVKTTTSLYRTPSEGGYTDHTEGDRERSMGQEVMGQEGMGHHGAHRLPQEALSIDGKALKSSYPFTTWKRFHRPTGKRSLWRETSTWSTPTTRRPSLRSSKSRWSSCQPPPKVRVWLFVR